MPLNIRLLGRTVLFVPIVVIGRLYSWVKHPLSYGHSKTQNHSSGVYMSDPQWGKRGDNATPPDLDEMLKKINQKLGGIFGSGGSGGNFNSPSKATLSGGFAIAASLIFSVWLMTGIYIVEEGKRGIELQLGQYKRTTQPGPNFHWPYPFEAVEIVNVSQVRAIEVGHRNNQKTKVREEALMLTEDQNIVDVQFAVQYTLKSPEEFLFKNRLPEEAVRQVAEAAMREIVGKSKMDFVLYEGRAEISARAKALMQETLNLYSTGIQISTVSMQNAQPPEQVQASFDDAVRAKQDRERLKNEGEAYANDILPKARGMAARLYEEANGYRQKVIANAQGDASRFTQVLAEYEKAPGVTRERMYIDAVQQVMQSTSKIYIDQKAGQSLLYLPLEKLIQQSSQSTAPMDVTSPSRSAEATVITPSTDISRSRELRNRDSR